MANGSHPIFHRHGTRHDRADSRGESVGWHATNGADAKRCQKRFKDGRQCTLPTVPDHGDEHAYSEMPPHTHNGAD